MCTNPLRSFSSSASCTAHLASACNVGHVGRGRIKLSASRSPDPPAGHTQQQVVSLSRHLHPPQSHTEHGWDQLGQLLDGAGRRVTAVPKPEGKNKGEKGGDARLGRSFQAVLDNLEFLFAGGKFLLQVVQYFGLFLSLKEKKRRGTLIKVPVARDKHL